MDLVGRDAELARVEAALYPEGPQARLAAVVGEAGIGKTALITAVTRAAEQRGVRVLRARGSSTETDLPFAGLHQLLHPVLDRAQVLTPRHRATLLTALGLSEEDAAPDRLVLGMAVLTLLSRLADDGSLLLVVDDVQWIDAATRSLLGFLARRLEGEPIGLLLGCRADRLPDDLHTLFPTVVLAPLAAPTARRLVDAVCASASPATRDLICTAALGNPLALLELSRTLRGDEPRHLLTLPVSELLERTFAAQLPHLPAGTRAAMLLAAAADTTDLATVHRALTRHAPSDAGASGSLYEAWLPAEQAGFLRLGPGLIEFRHPLVRAAVYARASFSERCRAHLALAESLHDDPDRRAVHLYAATATPDAAVAADVEAAADRALRRGATTEALAGYERAARVSPGRDERGRRLGVAAVMAFVAGLMPRAHDLAQQARNLTDDPAARVWTAQLSGSAAAYTLHLERAFDHVMGSLTDLGHDGAYNLLTVGAHIAHASGDPRHREQVAAAARIDPSAARSPFELWILAMTDPHRHGAIARTALPKTIAALSSDVAIRHLTGTLAAHLDEPVTAIELLEPIGGPDRPDAATGQGGMILADLTWAYLDTGQWDLAQVCADRIPDHRTDNLAGLTMLLADAALAALRGDTARARRQADQARATLAPAGATALLARAHWVAALAATADGDPETAYEQLRRSFTTDRAPLHYLVSCHHIADLAAAATRTGHTDQARVLLQSLRTLTGPGTSPRLRQSLARAEALLAPPADADDLFTTALADPAGETWPFERAQLQLDHGSWLRRARRPTDARTPLTRALHTFERLNAEPWTARARAELRAAGHAQPATGTPIADLPARTLHILRLAAQGHTNKEIGDRLYLSPRTVSSHLYQAFPKLGITSRTQLRDVLPLEDPQATPAHRSGP